MKPILIKSITWIILFSIAMAYLESAVVVYLREIYYPDGFVFPLTPIKATIAVTEFWREVATLVMLVGIGILTGKSAAQRLAFFLLSFAIWDIFYYVFLYLISGWPSSLMTWDILFLVPVPWVGPVLTPVIVSVLMIALAFCLIRFNKSLNKQEWSFSILGSLIIIISWVLDYWNFSSTLSSANIWNVSASEGLFETSNPYIPSSFNWYIFIVGVLIITITILSFYIRNNKNSKS